MADRRRCLVTVTVTGATFEGGLSMGPGQIVDLDQAIGGGRTLRECVDVAWFAPVPDVAEPGARQGNMTPSRRGGGRLARGSSVTETEASDGD